MEAGSTRSIRPRSPQPPGDPRWVALFYEPSSASWRLGAESPDRSPVLYAIGEMTQVKRARGDEVAVELWGPKDGAWQRFESSPAVAEAVVAAEASAPTEALLPESVSSGAAPGQSKLAERMDDRRHQVLTAGLSKAGLYDLAPDDATAVRTLVAQVDETTLRRVAHWLAVAGGAGKEKG
ncbi:hypothetical protein OG562_21250 [Streptomyces sp. NBC_01275]|uniref:hypothetical protein n=1 Tax=Streptomyces sp. NBC_01275 TaxID=2903807 RepID=UPI00224D06EE|nr:hypothetical protein [Streptomyces sp. NBC_01275]MCX4763447.1 hypothetical protein [Streptomyces sp. NBC_01275]